MQNNQQLQYNYLIICLNIFHNMSKEKIIEKEYDIFKDSELRYIGYSNEIGEAFRPIIPSRIVTYSYILEFVYFISDTIHKGHKAYIENKHDKDVIKHISKASIYTITWQCFASVILPAFTINRLVKLFGYLTRHYSKNRYIISYFPTFIGLSIIPVLPGILDPIVDKVMEETLGKYYT
jgi:fission process protein 1